MTISPVGAVAPSFVPMPVSVDAGAGASSGASGADFASQLGKGLDNLQALQNKADDLAVQAATGSLSDVHDYMIASTEASMATQLTVAVRNKAIDAFNEIMRMQG